MVLAAVWSLAVILLCHGSNCVCIGGGWWVCGVKSMLWDVVLSIIFVFATI